MLLTLKKYNITHDRKSNELYIQVHCSRKSAKDGEVTESQNEIFSITQNDINNIDNIIKEIDKCIDEQYEKLYQFNNIGK